MIIILKWKLICFCIIMHKTGERNAAPLETKSHIGRSFIMFPSHSSGSRNSETLTISSHRSPLVRVQMKISKSSMSYVLVFGGDVEISLPRSSRTANLDTAILVTSDREITLTVFNEISHTETAFVRILPRQWAGSYYIFPALKLRFYAVSALSDLTEVRVYFENNIEPMKQLLDRFQVYFSRDKNSVPQFLVSTKPVLVYCGYSKSAASGSTGSIDPNQAFYNGYLLPIEQWSTKYVCVGLEGVLSITSSGRSVQVVIEPCRTDVIGRQVKTIQEAGGSIKVKLRGNNCPAVVSASGVIQVTQLILQDAMINFYVPLNVVPEEKFLSTYTFVGNRPLGRVSLYLVIKEIYLSGVNFLGVVTKPTAVINTKVVDYGVYVFQPRQTGRITVYHTDGERFGLYIAFNVSQISTILSAAGMGYTGQSGNLSEHTARDMMGSVRGNMTDEEKNQTIVHGQCGEWNSWLCTSTCDVTEVRRRFRVCDSPAPSADGDWCRGEKYELGGRCVTDNDTCLMECPAGYWGAQSYCSLPCPNNCETGKCQVLTGICEDNSCTQGYRGDFCNISCARNTYGIGCLRMCTRRCVDTDCDRFTGECGTGLFNVQTLVIEIPFYIAFTLAIIMAIQRLREITTPKYQLQRLRIRLALLERQKKNLVSVPEEAKPVKKPRVSSQAALNKDKTADSIDARSDAEETVKSSLRSNFLTSEASIGDSLKNSDKLSEREDNAEAASQYFDNAKEEETSIQLSSGSTFQFESAQQSFS